MNIPVVTRAYDNARSGVNSRETELTAAAVKTRGVKRLFSLGLPGDRRGAEAQPLIVPGVRLPSGRVADLVLIATMANQVFAFDAKDGTRVWARTLGVPIDGNGGIDEHNINDHWGILSTPVIDAAAGIIYLCTWTSPNRSVAMARHALHALRVADGQDVHAQPLDFEGETYTPGHGRPIQRFSSLARKQRASLLLVGHTVFVAFGSVQETDQSARGWIIACDTAAWRVTAAWAAAARGFGGGIWQAGAGLAADGTGHLYCMTGNGTFDAVTDWAECFLKLEYRPPAAGRLGSIAVVDWWSPWTDDGRAGLDRSGDEFNIPNPTNLRAYTANRNAGWDDMDLGSGGPVLAERHGLVLGSGKDGILFVHKTDRMGKTQPADLDHPKGNYDKLAAPAIWFTFFPGFDVSPTPDDIKALNNHFFDRTHHLHGSPIVWNSPERGTMLFCWGENSNLRAWTLAANGVATYQACSAEVASAQSPAETFGGMPGGMMCLSADGDTQHTGVVWACIPYGDANMEITAGRLLAYDATTFGTFGDGSRQLQVLWDSQDWNLTFLFCKFTPPVVANGRLYVPTYGGRVDVYGLA
jgi:hypothetical protein